MKKKFCSSGELGLWGFALNKQKPLQAQAHSFQDLTAAKPETSAGVAKPSAIQSSTLQEFLEVRSSHTDCNADEAKRAAFSTMSKKKNRVVSGLFAVSFFTLIKVRRATFAFRLLAS